MTPKPGIPLNEPQTEAGRRMFRELTDYVRGESLSDHWPLHSILAIEREATLARPDARPVHVITEEHRRIEREARGIPLIDVERSLDEETAIHRIIDVIDNDEGGAELYEAALALYRARHPIEEGERPVPSRRADETHEQQQQRLRREEEDRL